MVSVDSFLSIHMLKLTLIHSLNVVSRDGNA